MSRGYVVNTSGPRSLGQCVHNIYSNGGILAATIYGNEELAHTVAALLNGEASCQPMKPKSPPRSAKEPGSVKR